MAELSDIEWAVKDIKDRSYDIALFRDYYDGRHRMPFATPRWRAEFYEVFKRLRDNLCARVVDIKADHLQLTALTGTSEAERDPLSVRLEEMWNRERLEERQGEVHKNALKDGDAFVIVWPQTDTNVARWYVQRGDRIACQYAAEPQGELAKAAKLWPTSEYEERPFWRLNLYYPDRIERYITEKEVAGEDIPDKPTAWLQFEEEDDDEAEATSVLENPYGVVPLFPFPNNADLGAYGRSELRDIIPIQDALNKSLSNMLVAGEFGAFPQRYILGLEVDIDESGKPTGSEQKAASDRILTVANPNAKAGQFEAANLENFIKEQDSLRQEIARISGSPLHTMLLAGEIPSGEALTVAERPLTTAIEDRKITFRGAWRSAASLALTIEGQEHNKADIVPQYKDTSYKSPALEAESLRLKKELGVPDEQLWREMGYTEKQIEEFAEAKEERRVEMQANFDAGIGGINPEATNGTAAAPLVR